MPGMSYYGMHSDADIPIWVALVIIGVLIALFVLALWDSRK